MIGDDALDKLTRDAGMTELPADERGYQVTGRWVARGVYCEMVRENVARLEVRHFPYPVRWSVESDGPNVLIHLDAEVRDRDTGVRFSSRRTAPLTLMNAIQPGALVKQMRRLLHTFVSHEVDEALHLEGHRVFDPHPQPRAVDPMVGIERLFTSPAWRENVGDSMDRVWSAIELRRFPYEMILRCAQGVGDEVRLDMRVRANDRDTGQSMLLAQGMGGLFEVFDFDRTIRRARQMVVDFVTHEVDEAIRLGEARPFDPHADDKPLPSVQRGGKPPRR